jgi:hypothetical protein
MASLVPVQVVADPSASDVPAEVHLPGAVMLRIGSGWPGLQVGVLGDDHDGQVV